MDFSKMLENRVLVFTVLGGAAATVAVISIMSRLKRKQRCSEMKHVGEVASLHCYPVKSLGGISHDVAYCTYAGMRMMNTLDRQFVIVRPNGDFITQRQVPKMVAVKTECVGDELILSAPSMPEMKVPLHPKVNRNAIVPCRVWGDHTEAQDCGSEVGQWLSTFLEEPDLRLLVLVPGVTQRMCTEKEANKKDKMVFQDTAPYHLALEASLADLKEKIGDPENEINFRNFRPTIVIKGDMEAWDEDNWSELQFGKYLRMKVVSPMTRCVLTTVDNKTLERRKDGEPLKTLKSFRIFPEVSKTSPLFGLCLGVRNENTIRVGDPVYVKYKASQ